jgi:hypothetical protein
MAEQSPGAVLRQLQQAQAVMKKARQALANARGGHADPQALLRIGWEALARANKILADIPISAATDPVLTKQLAVQRYATALLVRLRRIVRNEPGALDGIDEDMGEE